MLYTYGFLLFVPFLTVYLSLTSAKRFDTLGLSGRKFALAGIGTLLFGAVLFVVGLAVDSFLTYSDPEEVGLVFIGLSLLVSLGVAFYAGSKKDAE